MTISTGNLILIRETVNLIEAISNYQQLTHTENIKPVYKILEVRGTLLRNPVTSTVYYNYLSLFYNKKAIDLLYQNLPLDGYDILEIDGIKTIIQNRDSLSHHDKELILTYLYEAKSASEKALEQSQDDLMWKGFIKYNQARFLYFIELIEETETDWDLVMDEAVTARKTLNLLINDILDGKQSYLQDAFEYQEYLAVIVRMNFQITKGLDVPTYSGVYKWPNYEGLNEDAYIKYDYQKEFDRIHKFQRLLRSRAN
ncbi:hypothetical protein [Alkalibacillus almallahensis]|uniref:hypothetical protein n=1 Tax=Alkalibacillus almallahensis TaxID=1379154 RepID=UPI00142042E3|nr:hypothetical protein [Alkalibacillus almallahensis]